MRVTNNMLTRNYLRNMNKAMSNLAKSNDRMTSQRRFNKASENVADASKALRVRSQLADNERNAVNIRDAAGKYSIAEDNLRAINTIIQNVSERSLQGLNGTIAQSEKDKIAREVQNLQEEVFQISNLKYNEDFVFGAAGNNTGKPPFQVVDGVLSFNGTDVNAMQPGTGPDAGKIMYDPNQDGNLVEIPFNQDNYLDIGLGLNVIGSGANAVLDTKTAVKFSFSGADMFGFGMTDGRPNNIYNLLGRISEDMLAGNSESLGEDLALLKKQSDKLLMQITDLGNRGAFIEQTGDRLENDTFNLQKVQNALEAVPLQEESMYNKDFEMSWMVTLQMGSKILPPTIFDFMR